MFDKISSLDGQTDKVSYGVDVQLSFIRKRKWTCDKLIKSRENFIYHKSFMSFKVLPKEQRTT